MATNKTINFNLAKSAWDSGSAKAAWDYVAPNNPNSPYFVGPTQPVDNITKAKNTSKTLNDLGIEVPITTRESTNTPKNSIVPQSNSNALVRQDNIIGDVNYTAQKPQMRDITDMSKLMGGYNYNENKIRKMFDEATRQEYAAKRQANIAGQNEYASNVGSYINTLSDTMRDSLNKAVATGGSRGLIAAQALQAAQDASLQTKEGATALAQDKINLDYEEAAALAKNRQEAEALATQRKQDAINAAAALYGYDVQSYAALLSMLGQKVYGLDAADVNAKANIENNTRDNDTSKLVNERNILTDIAKSGLASQEFLDYYASLFGLAPGTLKPLPVNTGYSSGYSSGYSGGGSYNKNYSGGGNYNKNYNGGGSYNNGSEASDPLAGFYANAEVFKAVREFEDTLSRSPVYDPAQVQWYKDLYAAVYKDKHNTTAAAAVEAADKHVDGIIDQRHKDVQTFLDTQSRIPYYNSDEYYAYTYGPSYTQHTIKRDEKNLTPPKNK